MKFQKEHIDEALKEAVVNLMASLFIEPWGTAKRLLERASGWHDNRESSFQYDSLTVSGLREGCMAFYDSCDRSQIRCVRKIISMLNRLYEDTDKNKVPALSYGNDFGRHMLVFAEVFKIEGIEI